ncbi:hypothetical protein ANN_12592 [Periplaneta americana]|uniref:CHK kinase-like domain-containing protein n=1 Tax=Periplaneta americana TaxID=6978 RepID=A0ABQ8TIZ0_PERAM|nr:hypothetical protein ANN_12592 [Periplaneta americana]
MLDDDRCYDELPTEYLRNVVKSVLQNEGLDSKLVKITATPILASLWISSVFKVKAEDQKKSFHLFIKCLPLDMTRRKQMDSDMFFGNEVMFYNRVVTVFHKFEMETLPHVQRPFLIAPHCYRAETDGENDVIILEDMTSKGFVVLNRLRVLGVPELFLVMRKLGRFHGLSLAMKTLDPEGFHEARQCVNETVYCKYYMDKIARDVIEYAFEDAIKEAEKHFSEDSPYLVKLQKFSKGVAHRMVAISYGDPNNEPYNVITHGDMWVSNFMFHYSPSTAINKSPDEMCFIDFQQARYSSPGTDLGRLLFVSTDKSTRDAHREDLLRCYHDSVSDTVREFGCDPEKVFPFCAVEQQLKKSAAHFVGNVLTNLPHALQEGEGTDNDLSFDGDGSDELLKPFLLAYHLKTPECRRRILEVIEDVVEYGYMDCIL